jgi:S1-C subfamily serine protease
LRERKTKVDVEFFPVPMTPRVFSTSVFTGLLLLAQVDGGEASGPTAAPAPAKALSLLRQIDEGFVQVFEKVAPAVVVIEATKKTDPTEGLEEGRGLFLREGEETSKDSGDDAENGRLWRLPQQTRSEGSGFIVRADGFILTNFHVIAEADKLEARLKDGRTFPAKLVGADDRTDIAIIRVEAKGLPVAELGDSDAVRVGQLVCAIGAPFNQDYSFTAGWVSGKGRTNLIGPSSPAILYEDYIQTDAFINPGNSGGPLFDVEGRVIGMNTLINGIGRGLAFAIPSNMLKEVSTELIASGRVLRPWLGIRMESLQASGARETVTGIDKGVVIKTIEANAPAYKSDLRPADVVTEVDGVRLATARDLQKEILKKKVGQTIQLTVWRAGNFLKVPVTTGELPADFSKLTSSGRKALPDAKTVGLGLELKDAQPTGALVMKVDPESAAATADLQPADIITEVELKPVSTAAAAMAAMIDARTKNRNVRLTLERKGERTSVVIAARSK